MTMLTNKNKGPKACTTCAKAKARCNPGPEGSLKCERCLRLSKVCISQTPAPPRAKRVPKLSKIAALEKRLEELSSHVGESSSSGNNNSHHIHSQSHNQNQRQGPSPSETPSPTPEAFPQKLVAQKQKARGGGGGGGKEGGYLFDHLFPVELGSVDEAIDAPSRATAALDRPREEEQRTPTPRPFRHGATAATNSMWPSPSEAERLLGYYKTVHGPLFPFVVIPEYVTAAEVRQQRPYLWKAILLASCGLDGQRHVRLGDELLADISRGTIVEGSKSLDLLHGLQILIAWYSYALKGVQLTNLLFLARAMCANLDLKDGVLQTQGERPENLEHMRAYAGTYYVNTLVFTANKRPDVFMNTAYLETCCKVLESRMDLPTDGYLVKLVRIQQLAQSISLTTDIDNFGPQSTRLPLMTIVRSFQDQLNSFDTFNSLHGAEDATLKSHVLLAETLLYEVAISDRHTTASYVPHVDRLQLLWSCLRSVKEFFANRFASREVDRPRFLSLNASDFVFAIITGMKLATLQLPGWNLAHVHSELDIVGAMDEQMRDLVLLIRTRQMEQSLSGDDEDVSNREDPLVRLMRQLKTLRDLSKMELDRLRRTAAAGDMMGVVAATPSDDVGNGVVEPEAMGMQDTTVEFGEMDMQFWQTMGMDNVWSVIGDPTMLDAPM